MEEVTSVLANLLSLVSILREQGETRKRIAELLGRTVRIGESTRATFKYVKELGELPPSKVPLLRMLKEHAYAPYEPGMRVELVVNDHYVFIAEEGRENNIIDSGYLGSDVFSGFRLSFFLKLALYFDEKDWEEMRRIAAEKLREEAELLERLKAIAAAIELLLNK